MTTSRPLFDGATTWTHPDSDEDYVEGRQYEATCAAHHSGRYNGVRNGFLVFSCSCGDQFAPAHVGLGGARERRDAAQAQLEAAIVRAFELCEPIAEIARQAGMSRQAIYDVLDRRGAR